jgi:signal transduction histidine kinase
VAGNQHPTALGKLHPGEPVVDNAPHSDEWGYAPDANLTALLVVPLTWRATIIGMLHLVNKPGGFREQDVRLVSLFADQAPIAIENARLSQQVEQIAILEERQRLARELHDSVTQSLYSVTLYTEAALRHLKSGNTQDAAEYLNDLRYTAREALHEMRLLIFELRPPILEHEGLVAALQARLDAVEKRSGLHTHLYAEVGQQFPPAVAEELYRVAQEALNNVIKHAQAQNITLHLQSNETVVLEVRDDGIGFDPADDAEQRGMGWRGMEERMQRIGGHLSIESAAGAGTCVRAEVSLRGV